MKVSQVTPYYNSKGGISTVVKSLSKQLTERGIDLTIISPDIYDINNKSYRVRKKLVLKILDIFKKLKLINPDVIHVHAHGTLLIGMLLYKYLINRNVKIIMTMHTQPINKSYIKDAKIKKRSSIRNLLLNQMLKKIDKVVFVSQSLLEDYKKYMQITISNSQVIYNGINTEEVNKIDVDKFIQKYKIGELTDNIIISMVSNLQWNLKVFGVVKLIECFDMISHENDKNLKLYIAGDGMYRNYIESIISKTKNPNVFLLGHIDEVKELLFISNIYAHISPMEGCSTALLEAMSMKKNIVTINGGGNEELIRNNINGLIVDFDNEQIFNALKLMCDNLDDKKFSNNAYKDFNDKFTSRYMCDNYLELYNYKR